MEGGTQTYVAHDGKAYQWPPPTGWWQASDGRWYPPQEPQPSPAPDQHEPASDQRPWWQKKRFLIPIGLLLLLGLAGAFVDPEDEESTDETEASAPAETGDDAVTTTSDAVPTTVTYAAFSDVDPFTHSFFIALEDTTLAADQGEERLWGLGRGVCQNLDRGNQADDEVAGLVDDARLAPDDARALVVSAVTWICDQHA